MARRPAESTLLFDLPEAPNDAIERRLKRRGVRLVAGIDEAGRGPLAGPVVAAAVILDPRHIPEGLDDSKRLDRAQRERLFAEIMAHAAVSVAAASAARIGATDIRKATLWAMARAAAGLPLAPEHALVDGIDVPPGLGCSGEAVVKGDQRSVSIAAASVVAKVTRDAMMVLAGRHYPQYGFERHMGYGTVVHLEALRTHGACVLHRTTFAPVRAVLAGENAAGGAGGAMFDALVAEEAEAAGLS